MDMVEPPTHTQTSTRSSTYTAQENKPIFRVHFWDPQQRYGFINLNPAFTEYLIITSDTELTQELITVNGRRGIFVSERNRTAGGYHANPADQTDSVPNYQSHV